MVAEGNFGPWSSLTMGFDDEGDPAVRTKLLAVTLMSLVALPLAAQAQGVRRGAAEGAAAGNRAAGPVGGVVGGAVGGVVGGVAGGVKGVLGIPQQTEPRTTSSVRRAQRRSRAARR